MGCVGCVPVGVDYAGPAVGCSGFLVTCSSKNLCPATDYMTSWKQMEAMSDYYRGVDDHPVYFDYDDPIKGLRRVVRLE